MPPSSVVSRAVHLGLVLLVAACSPERHIAPTEEPLPPAVRAASSTASAGAIRTLDDEYADLVDEIPGFGGLYYDADGTPVIYLKSPATLGSARTRVAAHLERGAGGNASRITQIAGEVSRLRVRSARYDFRELRGWYNGQLVSAAFAMPGVVMTDIDERRNQIVIGVRDGPSIPAVRSSLSRLGVPTDAFVVVEYAVVSQEAPSIQSGDCDPITAIIPCAEEPPTAGFMRSVRDKSRPVIGGLQIQYNDSPYNWNCTLGYNIAHRPPDGTINPERFFMTASHCGDAMGVMTAMEMSQSTVGEVIGAEVADPSFFTNSVDPLCPGGRLCRYSDAALFSFGADIGVDHGRTAFPSVGSLTFSQIRMITGAGDPAVGMTVHKIGRTTGRTTGTVQQTCMILTVFDRFGSDTGFRQLCQSVASYASAGGDSGAPVVQVWPDGTLVARGIHWRGSGGFSPINGALRELRSVTGGGLGPTIGDLQ